MFSVVAFSFSIPKFLENRKIFEKNCPKISAIAAENQKKMDFFSRHRRTTKKVATFQRPLPFKTSACTFSHAAKN
jgi:hypothetical protein